jgi:small subunit ribosomal protein S6
MSEERNYEVLFIVDSQLDEEDRNSIISKIKDLIAENGSLGKVNEWGNRKLAYEIADRTEGYYTLIEFVASSDFPLELERILKITDGVLKYIIVNKDK